MRVIAGSGSAPLQVRGTVIFASVAGIPGRPMLTDTPTSRLRDLFLTALRSIIFAKFELAATRRIWKLSQGRKITGGVTAFPRSADDKHNASAATPLTRQTLTSHLRAVVSVARVYECGSSAEVADARQCHDAALSLLAEHVLAMATGARRQEAAA